MSIQTADTLPVGAYPGYVTEGQYVVRNIRRGDVAEAMADKTLLKEQVLLQAARVYELMSRLELDASGITLVVAFPDGYNSRTFDKQFIIDKGLEVEIVTPKPESAPNVHQLRLGHIRFPIQNFVTTIMTSSRANSPYIHGAGRLECFMNARGSEMLRSNIDDLIDLGIWLNAVETHLGGIMEQKVVENQEP